MRNFTNIFSIVRQASTRKPNNLFFFNNKTSRFLIGSLLLLAVLGTGTKSYAVATLAYAGGAYAASNGCQGTTVIIQEFTATNSTARNITAASFVTGGTYVTADVTHFQIWKNTSYTLTGATLVGTFASAASGSTIAGATTVTAMGTVIAYYMITATIAGTATAGHTITIPAITGAATKPFTVSGAPPAYSGTIAASGAMTIQALPTGVTATASPNPICLGSNLTLTGTATGATTYAWTGPGGTAITSPTSLSTGVTGVAAGNAGVYTLTASSAFCSTAAVSTAVTVNSVPAILGNAPVCVGSTITLSDASGAGTWSSSLPAYGSIGLTTGAFIGIAGPANPVITYVNTATGCSITAIATVNAEPTAITGPTSVCTGNSINLTDGLAGGAWTSSAPGTGSVDPVLGVVTGIAAGTTTISYTTASCVPVTYIVTVNASPTPILGASYVCLNATTTLTDATASGLWTSSNPGIANIDPSTGIVSGVVPGTSDITYTVPSTGCNVTAAFTVNALPVIAAIGGVTDECLGLTATLTETTAGGVWSSADATIASIGSTGIVTGNTLGTTTMSYTVTDAFGCINTVTTPDTVNAFPVVDAITGASSVCINASTTLSDDTLTGMWTSSDITIATIDPVAGTMTGVTAGAVTISYTVTNIYGCATSVTAAETVNPLPVVSAITGPATNVCSGSTLQLSDVTAGGTWSSSSTSVATVGSSGVVTGVALGSDNISYTVSNTFGCTNSAIYAITVGNAMPASAVLPADTSITLCHGNPENLVVNTTGTGLTYQWYMNGSAITGATNGSYVVTVPGQYVVQLSNGTCVLDLPYTDVIAPPNPIIGYNSTGPELFTGDFTTYQWFLNGVAITTISSGASSAVLPITLDGAYTVVVSDANGCFDTSAVFNYPVDTATTGINNVSGNTAINVFPNPGTSTIHISAPVSVNIAVMSTDGKIILEQKQATEINVGTLPDGMYIIRIYDEHNVLLKNQKFTKIE